jgi:hypothetical protein
MAAYNKATIQGFFTLADSAATSAARGKAFEDLACYLFGCVPGITITARNVMNSFATEEIDVACRNDQDPAGLRMFNAFFLVECKGWAHAVGSEQVSWFLTKIEHRALDFGVLIAANDITGDAEHLSRAHFLVAMALASKKIRMVIITRAEILTLNSGEELAELIINKVCTLHATGGRCF